MKERRELELAYGRCAAPHFASAFHLISFNFNASAAPWAEGPSISSIPFHCRLIDSIKSKIFFHQLPLVVPFIDSIPFSWFIPQSLSLCVCLPFRGANGASAHNRASKPTSKGEIAFIHTALALLPSQLSILFQFH